MISIELQEELDRFKDLYRLPYSILLKSKFADIFKECAEALNSTQGRQIAYHAEIESNTIPNCNCGNPLGWHPDNRVYRLYCSSSCTAKWTTALKKVANMEKYGVEWHTQKSGWQEQVKATNLEKHGYEWHTQRPEFKDLVKETCIEKYGVDHYTHTDWYNDGVKIRSQEKYGVDHFTHAPEVKAKYNNTMMDRYGTTVLAHVPGVQDASKASCQAKYGYDFVGQVPSIRIKINDSRRNNYYTPAQLEKLEDIEWLKEQQKTKPLWAIAEEIGISPSNIGVIFQKNNIEVIRHPRSEMEHRLYDYYCNKVTTVPNTRFIIGPKELDIFFPDNKLAIEVDGVFYHSERFNKYRFYHLEKVNECNELGISLMRFWDMELEDRWSQVTNYVNSKLNLHEKIFARKTTIVIVNPKSKSKFIEDNHIQGDVGSSTNIGLLYEGELVMVATFGKPRYAKAQYELLRLCSIAGKQIVGGASKLIKHFVKNYMNTGEVLLSYCDRRYCSGKVCLNSGFTLSHISDPGFFYITSSGAYAGTRYQWQKHLLKDKLPIFDNTLTADANMTMNNYLKVWDCGQYVFHLTKG